MLLVIFLLEFFKPLVKLTENRVYQYCKLHINVTFVIIKYYLLNIFLVPLTHDALLYDNLVVNERVT